MQELKLSGAKQSALHDGMDRGMQDLKVSYAKQSAKHDGMSLITNYLASIKTFGVHFSRIELSASCLKQNIKTYFLFIENPGVIRFLKIISA